MIPPLPEPTSPVHPDPGVALVRRATAGDLDTVTAILAAGFFDGDLASWLVPDPDERAHVYPAYFQVLAEHALIHGMVDLIDDTAVAVWHEHHAAAPLDTPRDAERLAAVTGARQHRFHALDTAMRAHHPTYPDHHYLALLAVRPVAQGQGLGTALLRHHHHTLDATGTAAYLEATGPANKRLYWRHGYQSRPTYRPAPDSPLLTPMWRNPRTHPTP